MTYSDEKNPYVTHLRNYCKTDPDNHECCDDWSCRYRTSTGCYFSNCITSYEEGYQQAEKDGAFTGGEKIVLTKLLNGINWELGCDHFDMHDVESLKKKVMGE